MPLKNLDRNQLQQILLQLEQALYTHQQWLTNLTRNLVCRLPFDKHDSMEEAHKECRFGQWYYTVDFEDLKDNPSFLAIGEAHKNMHQFVKQIANTLDNSENISPHDYDSLFNSVERLRLEIFSFKAELETLVYTRDPLTMTINRVNMLPILREQQTLLKRQASRYFCLAMIDLDFFKKINDQYGHIIGDKVLNLIAQYLINHLRPEDKIFRYGGEEFLISLTQLDISEAVKIIDHLREEISKTQFKVGLPNPINITISAGLTMLDPNLSVEEAIDQADKALYQAKTSGRNKIHIWKQDNENPTS